MSANPPVNLQTRTGSATYHNAQAALAALIFDVRNDLLRFNLITEEEPTPMVMVVAEVMRQRNDVCSRLLGELSDHFVPISMSKMRTQLWKRRPHNLGPVVNQVNLAVATLALDHVHSEQKRLLGLVPTVRASESAAPVYYWKTFTTEDGSPIRNARQVHTSPVYLKLLEYFTARRHGNYRWNRGEAFSVDDLLSPSNPLAPPDRAAIANAVRRTLGGPPRYPEGQDYHETSGNVTSGFTPNHPRPSMPINDMLSPPSVPPSPPE